VDKLGGLYVRWRIKKMILKFFLHLSLILCVCLATGNIYPLWYLYPNVELFWELGI